MSTSKPYQLNFSLPFSEAISDLRTSKGRKMRVDSHNYHVLFALFSGDTIDDYQNKPLDANGHQIHNIKTRISDLSNMYNIKIERAVVSGEKYVEYWIDRDQK